MTFKAIRVLPPPTSVSYIAPISETFTYVLDDVGKIWIFFLRPDGETEWRLVGPPVALEPPP